MQRLAETVQRQGLHVVFEVGRRLLRVGASEGAQLARRHGQWPAAVEQVAQAHADLAPQAAGDLVQGRHVADLVDHAQLQVVLEVAADTGHLMGHTDPQALQQCPRADAGALQQARRADGASSDDDLAARLEALLATLPMHQQGLRPALFEDHPLRLGAGQYRQVRPLADAAQETLRGVPAHPAALVDLEIAAAFVVAAVEVLDAGDAGLRRRLLEGIQQRPRQALALHPPFAAGAVQFADAAEMVLHAVEQRQQLLPAPARIALGHPLVVVAGLATHIDHAVDRGAATEHLAARVLQGAAVEAGHGIGCEAPVGARIADAVEVADGDVDPGVVVRPAGLQQQDAIGRVGG
ncbi:hypothetical protein D9M68_579920 [compost metagenome]